MRRIKLILGALTLLLVSVQVNADTYYTFTKIADTVNPDFGDFANSGPAINDNGFVSFIGCSTPPGVPDPDCGFFKGDGSTIVKIADAVRPFGQRTSINNAGVVAFESDGSVIVGDGGPVVVIADSSGATTDSNGDPIRAPAPGSINDAGEVSFTAILEGDAGGIGVFKGSGGAITTIESRPGAANQVSSIDSSGNVAYEFSSPIRAIRIGDGSSTRTVVDDSGEFFQFGAPSLNELGAVAFGGVLDELPTGERAFGVYVAEPDGSITVIADNSIFRSFAQVSLNDSGKVAFKAQLNDDFGIYTGSDPIQDKVIVPGDDLFGSTVKVGEPSLFLHNESLNNTGQIAFQARLADGTIGIYRADPVPKTITVNIDIKPGSDPNSINPRSKGVIPVAVLGSTDFDAMQVDPEKVNFGPDGATPKHDGHVEDVNDDGYMDMMFHFRTQETGIVCGDTEATLTGALYDGTPITGTDSVNTVGCKGKSSNKVSDEEAEASSSTTAGAMSWMLLLGLGVIGVWRQTKAA